MTNPTYGSTPVSVPGATGMVITPRRASSMAGSISEGEDTKVIRKEKKGGLMGKIGKIALTAVAVVGGLYFSAKALAAKLEPQKIVLTRINNDRYVDLITINGFGERKGYISDGQGNYIPFEQYQANIRQNQVDLQDQERRTAQQIINQVGGN